MRPLLKAVDAKLEVARLIGDGVVSAFFDADKPKERIKRLVEFQKAGPKPSRLQRLGQRRRAIRCDAERRASIRFTPFHWEMEFPEVFARENGGFDAIVGNPPFAGKNTIIAGHREELSALAADAA